MNQTKSTKSTLFLRQLLVTVCSLLIMPQTVGAQTVAPEIPLMATMTTTPGSADGVMANSEPIVDATKNDFPEIQARPARRTMTVVATAYSSEAAQTDSTPCIPAMWKFDLCKNFAETGIEDTIAANFLALGTKVRFPDIYGDKVFTVRDRMNAKYNGKSRIDFWKSEKPLAVHFGVKRLKMEVL